jgi:5-methylcytosine-specific restriction endonuclease McrA
VKNISSSEKRALRVRLIADLGPRCHYCSASLNLESMTIEHIVPWSLGGRNAYFNLVPACCACNHDRGNSRHACSCARCRSAWARYRQVAS